MNTLQKGKEQLNSEALGRISDFVVSQRTDEHVFMDKSGKADLYYTLFGWMLSYTLGLKTDVAKAAPYLKQFERRELDLVHYAALMRCRMLKHLMQYGRMVLWLKHLHFESLKSLNNLKGLPHDDMHSPYTQYIWLSLLEDTRQPATNAGEMLRRLSAYRIATGGYANTPGGQSATTNATVAALAITGQLEGYKDQADIRYLRNSQQSTGGFRATDASPVPDMLSTATSLFMLSCYGMPALYPAEEFVEAHWLDDGGFSATILDDKSDVEYTFYGLLALGAIQMIKENAS